MDQDEADRRSVKQEIAAKLMERSVHGKRDENCNEKTNRTKPQ